jgi:hypothetical protein
VLPLQLAVFSAVLVGLSFWLQGRIGLTYSDEGFLWYGAVRTLAGDSPILDFQSYDPGRYYWSAFWMTFLGESMLALRGCVALFQLLSVYCGLLALSRAHRSWRVFVPVGLLLIVWMSPRYYRLFEVGTSLIALYFAVLLIERPSLRRHFVVGAFTGLAAFLGRNLGLYTAASFGLLILFVWARVDKADWWKKTACWSLGILAGYSPMLIMLVAVPGFYESIFASLMEMVDRGSTNIPLPIPWPWVANYSRLNLSNAAHAFSNGALFLWMPLFYLSLAFIIARTPSSQLRSRAVLIAGIAVGSMYMHYAYSRADLEHLLVPMPVLLVTMAAVPFDFGGGRYRVGQRLVLASFAILTLLSAGLKSPLYLKASTPAKDLVAYDVGGTNFWISASGAKLIASVQKIDEELIPKDEGLLIVPFWSAFYVMLERESPLRELYFTDQQPEAHEHAAIERLKQKRVNWVLLGNVSLQENSFSRFRATHPLLFEHLRRDFVAVKVDGLRRSFSLLQRRVEID